jgi:hypothetical protein
MRSLEGLEVLDVSHNQLAGTIINLSWDHAMDTLHNKERGAALDWETRLNFLRA